MKLNSYRSDFGSPNCGTTSAGVGAEGAASRRLDRMCINRRRAKHMGRTRCLALCLALACGVSMLPGIAGCGQLTYRLTSPPVVHQLPNPLDLPAVADDFVWMQVIDVTDDYFRIAKEQPVQNNRELILDGRLETAYRVGGSIFEPWRKDSTPGFERLQSTLQSIRRRAIITVRPSPEGYVVEVVVQKDLEDTDRTQYATETTAGVRHDGSLVRVGDDVQDGPQTLGWIPLGRDASLEQRILADILGRITQADRPERLLH
ncbi:MAG: hypothetical protein AAF989_15870 [Planctomycetota bacterium]